VFSELRAFVHAAGVRGMMKMRHSSALRVVAVFFVFSLASGCVLSQSSAPQPAKSATPLKGTTVTNRASGTFEVKLSPQPLHDKIEGATLGRMSIDKQFRGDLEAASKGEMLSAMTATKGSAGYVAIEAVTGTLNGRRGTFVLQHTGSMDRATPSLSVSVVPDSGTGELIGLRGNMQINVTEGKHSYVFEYVLAEAK
jgi:Protein of unknown function (DUF3224)